MQTKHQPKRRSANYKQNIWKYDILNSLSNSYEAEEKEKRAEELKEYVKYIYTETIFDQLRLLEMINDITNLGLESLFNEEIETSLAAIAADRSCSNDLPLQGSLYATSLRFRLLRQHGYNVSQDDFVELMKEKGEFRSYIAGNVEDVRNHAEIIKERSGFGKQVVNFTEEMVELFEASHFCFEGETIMENACDISTRSLKRLLSKSQGNQRIKERVAHALKIPANRRVMWYEVRWQINEYEKRKDMNPMLLELAKMNHNMIQATLQKDLAEISRWWKNLGLMESLKFARDRVGESFICAMGLAHEPHSRSFRKWLTKLICLILVVDDVYDVYGSLEELHLFTSAVDQWDASATEKLPDCMKVCFNALYTITNDTAFEISEENGWKHVSKYLRKAWAEFCKALYVEAKWSNASYRPSLQEYLNNAWISSSGPLILAHALFASKDEIPGGRENFLEKHHHLVYNISLVIRLCNDLETSSEEQKRGDVPSAVVCYMEEAGVTEEEARKHLKRMIEETWKNINKLSFMELGRLKSFFGTSSSVARIAYAIYRRGDGFGSQVGETKRQILSLLVQPLVA